MAASDAAVRALLAKIGLQGLAAKFAEHGVDDSCLETIEDEDLAEMRIGPQTRERILSALETPATREQAALECPLCLDAGVQVKVGCGHCFCAKCLGDWRAKTPRGVETLCPTCRAPVASVTRFSARSLESWTLQARVAALEAENQQLRDAGAARADALDTASAGAAANDARAAEALRLAEWLRERAATSEQRVRTLEAEKDRQEFECLRLRERLRHEIEEARRREIHVQAHMMPIKNVKRLAREAREAREEARAARERESELRAAYESQDAWATATADERLRDQMEVGAARLRGALADVADLASELERLRGVGQPLSPAAPAWAPRSVTPTED